MGLLDRLLGRGPSRTQAERGYADERAPQTEPAARRPGGSPRDSDEAAIERYRYLLRTAPPDAIEQAHAEAFEQLTPQQRREVLAQLTQEVPPGERQVSDDPRSLARMATRAEMRQPGTLERSFGGGRGMGAGMGMGGLLAGSLLASVAGAFVGTAIADAMFDASDAGDAGSEAGSDGGSDAGSEAGDSGDAGGDVAADPGAGDAGGDFGGGDLGGGDFGAGDFGGGFGDVGGFGDF